jgi:hypothetical protein
MPDAKRAVTVSQGRLREIDAQICEITLGSEDPKQQLISTPKVGRKLKKMKHFRGTSAICRTHRLGHFTMGTFAAVTLTSPDRRLSDQSLGICHERDS